MKNLFLFVLFVCNISFSQDLLQNLKSFKSIHINSAMDVELVSSDSAKIEVTGNDLEKLNISDDNNELKLSTSLDKKFKSDLKVIIYYMPGLRNIKLANQVKITSRNVINEKFLELEAVNGVKANLSVKTKDLVSILSLGSKIALEGITESQKINASTKSFYDAFNLISEKAYVEAKTSNVAVYVNQFLDANAKYKGEIIYMGDPYSVNEKTFLGKVIHKKK
ncbi:GIN domain-containing protein [Wenyingzhuangia sp. IMCC45467]